MRLTRHYPKTYESLRELLLDASSGAESVVIQAGHFLLIYDEHSATISPCISGEPSFSGNQLLSEMYGHFPLLTWTLAFRILNDIQTPTKYIMTVVNDWQYLPKQAKRSDFYLNQEGKLPNVFQQIMGDQTGASAVRLLQPEPVGNGVSTAPFFGEMNLRNRYHRRVTKLVKNGELPNSVVTEETNEGFVCRLPDLSGSLEEIYCNKKTGDCTAEIAEMLRMASERTSATCFINLYPSVCRGFVELGTSRSVELFNAPLRTVLNVGFPSSGVTTAQEILEKCEVSYHRF